MNKMMGQAIILVCLMIATLCGAPKAQAQCDTPTFSAPTNLANSCKTKSMIAGDFNGDGFLDLALASEASNTINVQLGQGNGSFVAGSNLTLSGKPLSIASADFDSNGILDLVVVGKKRVTLHLGQGNGTFSNASTLQAGLSPEWVVTGDFNQDSRIDLAIANFKSNNVSILFGQGNGSFSAATNLTVGANPQFVTTGDFNGDGRLDLAVANTNANSVSILLNQGNGTFGAPTNLSVGNYPRSIAVGDFNGDGIVDIATANAISGNVSVLINQGGGSFGAATNLSVGRLPLFISAADINFDNKLDIVVSNSRSGSVSFLLGQGTGQFAAASNLSLGTVMGNILTGDFNGDGRLDLLVTDLKDCTVRLLTNNCVPQCPQLNFSAGTLPTAAAGVAFNHRINVTGFSGPITLTATGLPAGLSLTPSGEIVGTPSVTGTFNFTVTARFGNNCTASQNFTLTVGANCVGFSLPPAAFANARKSEAFNHTLAAIGASGAVTYRITAGNLPTGLTLSPTGVISGTPTVGGAFSFTVTATDANGCVATQTYSMSIAEGCTSAFFISDITLTAKINVAVNLALIVNSSGQKLICNALGLPEGLSINAAGVLIGTPKVTGIFQFKVTLTDANNCVANKIFTINILDEDQCELRLSMNNCPPAIASVMFNHQIIVAGGVAPFTFRVGSGLPNGLTVSSTGLISGVPTQTGDFHCVLIVTDANGCIATLPLDLKVGCPAVSFVTTQISGTVGVSMQQQLAVAGGFGPYSFVVAGGLPAGLTLDPVSGLISGTPTQVGTFNLTFTAFDANSCATISTPIAIVIGAGAPGGGGPSPCPNISLIMPTLTGLVAGGTVNAAITATGGTGSYTFTANGLPAGLSLAANGMLTGTLNFSGNRSFNITVTDSAGCTANAVMSLTVGCSTFQLNMPAVNVAVGSNVNANITAAGGVGSYTFVASGLPAGLTLNANGTLTGSVTTAGTFTFNVTATDGAGCTASRSFTITVGCPTLTIGPDSLKACVFGAAFNETLTVTGGSGNYTFTLASGTLPTGLTLAANGTISGTVNGAGRFTFTVRVTDNVSGCSVTREFVILAGCPDSFTVTGNTINVTVGADIDAQLSASGGLAPYTFAAVGALPAGIDFAIDGSITGSILAAGTYTFDVAITDNNNCTPTVVTTVTINVTCPTLTLSAGALANATVGALYNQQLTVNGAGNAAVFLSIAGLPDGLSVARVDGTTNAFVITGTPTVAGSFNLTISYDIANGCNTFSTTLALTVQ